SLTQGSGSTGGQAYPEQCMALLGANYYGLAVGRAGEQISEAAPDAAAQVDAYYRGAAFPRDAVVFWAGTNDFYFEAGQATVRTRYQNYCAARRAAGWKVIAATLLPRQDAGVPAGHEAERTSFNAWLREGWPGFADALADVG